MRKRHVDRDAVDLVNNSHQPLRHEGEREGHAGLHTFAVRVSCTSRSSWGLVSGSTDANAAKVVSMSVILRSPALTSSTSLSTVGELVGETLGPTTISRRPILLRTAA